MSQKEKKKFNPVWIPLQADFSVLRQTSTNQSRVQRLHALENDEPGNRVSSQNYGHAPYSTEDTTEHSWTFVVWLTSPQDTLQEVEWL
jgi:hypothetical protein